MGYADVYFEKPGAGYAFMLVFEGNPGTGWDRNYWIGDSGDKPVKNVWETYEMQVVWDNVAADSGGTGLIRFWKNKVLIGTMSNLPTLKAADHYSDQALLFTYWNGNDNANFPPAQSMYVDDIKIQTSTPGQIDAAGNPLIGT
jgi:hypothetical protein